MKKILIILLIIALPLLLILDNTKQIIYNHSELIEEQYKETDENILEYFKGEKQEIQGYTEKEQSHMKDVKCLIKKGFIVYSILIIVLIASLVILDTKQTAKALIIGSLITLGLIIILALLNFSFTFEYFHKIFFEAGTWQFNEGIMTKMYTSEFFQETAKRIAINTFWQSFALLLISLGIRFINKTKKR